VTEATPDTPARAEPVTPAGPDAPRTLPRWRRILVAFLVVLGCVLTPVSIVAVWIHATLLDTDQWVDTVGPLIDSPNVQDAVAARLTTAVINGADLEDRVEDVLPTRAQVLAPAIVEGARQAVGAVSLRIVQSDQFETLWDQANRRAHKQVVAVLQGKGTDTIQTENGQIVLDLAPLISEVRERLNDRGISLFNDLDIKRVDRQIVIFSSEDLRRAQSVVDVLDTLAWWLPIVTVIAFAAAIALSGNRRRTLLRGSLGVALAVGLVLTAFNLGRTAYLDALPERVNRGAAEDLYDQLLTFLRTSLRTAFVFALVVALAAWLSGPSRVAVRIRQSVGRGVDRTGDVATAPSGVGSFVGLHRNVLRVLVVALGLIVLMALAHPSPWSVLIIAVLVLVGLLVIEVLGRGGAPTSPEGGAAAAS
jgi:hypothetical protein